MRIPTANLARFTLRSATSALLLLTACSDDASDDAATTQGGRGGRTPRRQVPAETGSRRLGPRRRFGRDARARCGPRRERTRRRRRRQRRMGGRASQVAPAATARSPISAAAACSPLTTPGTATSRRERRRYVDRAAAAPRRRHRPAPRLRQLRRRALRHPDQRRTRPRSPRLPSSSTTILMRATPGRIRSRPATVKIEGGTAEACDGDCHLLDGAAGRLHALRGLPGRLRGDGAARTARSGIWARTATASAEKGWTSADAARLAIAPGLVRYDEVRAGEVRHAIRFTVRLHPQPIRRARDASGGAGQLRSPTPKTHRRWGCACGYAPTTTSRRSGESARVVARAMQRYGMILADNGSNFYFQGEDNP